MCVCVFFLNSFHSNPNLTHPTPLVPRFIWRTLELLNATGCLEGDLQILGPMGHPGPLETSQLKNFSLTERLVLSLTIEKNEDPIKFGSTCTIFCWILGMQLVPKGISSTLYESLCESHLNQRGDFFKSHGFSSLTQFSMTCSTFFQIHISEPKFHHQFTINLVAHGHTTTINGSPARRYKTWELGLVHPYQL